MKTLGPAALGEGPGPRSPPARGSRVLAPTGPPSWVALGRAREPVLQHLASFCHSLQGAKRAREGRGAPGRPRDRRPPPRPGLPRCARLPRVALRRVCRQSSPGVSARPGRGGRAVRAGCRGRGRAGVRGGNPRLVLPLPGSLSLSPRGARDWQPSPVTHSPRVHIPGEGIRKVINLHQATFPIT